MQLLDHFKNKTVYCCIDADLDGMGATILVEYFVKPVVKGFIRYNTADRSLPDFDFELAKNSEIIIFIDITPPTLGFYNKLKEFSEVFIFDHHVTGKDILGNLENYYFDTEKCASKIFFEEITKNIRVKRPIAQFIELIDTYDLYHVDSLLWRNAKALNNILWSYVDWSKMKYETDTERHNHFIKSQLTKFDKGKVFYFTAKEVSSAAKAEQKEKTNYEEAKRNLKIRVDNSNNKYGYTECTSKLSWVVSLLLKDHPELNYIIAWSSWKKDSLKLSLRSQGNFSVSDVCKVWADKGYQAGGHKQASALEIRSKEEFEAIKTGKIHLI